MSSPRNPPASSPRHPSGFGRDDGGDGDGDSWALFGSDASGAGAQRRGGPPSTSAHSPKAPTHASSGSKSWKFPSASASMERIVAKRAVGSAWNESTSSPRSRGGVLNGSSTETDSVAKLVANRVNEAKKLAEYKRKEKLDRVQLAVKQAEHETGALLDDGVDNFALEEMKVLSDGTSGNAAWMLTCAVVEGATGDQVKPLLEELTKYECDFNRAGNRINQGKGITPLVLLCSMLEQEILTPQSMRAKDENELNRDAAQEEALQETEIEGALYTDAVADIRKQSAQAAQAYKQSSTAIVEFATALLALGIDVNVRCKISPETSSIADSRIAPYLGIPGTEGGPLFFCALAVISGAGDEVLQLAARLISEGAHSNIECTRPGRHACCGKFLTPLTVLCAALESSIAYGLTDSHKNRLATFAAMIVQNCADINLSIESTFTHRLTKEELEMRRIAPIEVHTLLRGPAVFILACALIEGVGVPAMVVMDLLLKKIGTFKDEIVGARPHHGRKLPLLAMVVDAIDAPHSFNANGFISTRAWWESAAVKANVSDMGSMLGANMMSGSAGPSELDAVDAAELAALDEFLPEINDAAFDGHGAVARMEQEETEKRRQFAKKTDSEIAAEEARELKSREIAATIAAMENAKLLEQKQADAESDSDSESDSDEFKGDTESTLAEKGATQYTDENGNTFLVGFTAENLRPRTLKAEREDVSDAVLQRQRTQNRSSRNARFTRMVEQAQNVSYALIEASEKMVNAIRNQVALSENDDTTAFGRPTQARLDCIDLVKQLLHHGCSPNVEMKLEREYTHACADSKATPFGMVCGYIVRNMLEAVPLFELMLKRGADVNCRSLGPYPIFSPPLYSIAMALYNNVEGADKLMDEILLHNVAVDLKAVFPDGSKSTTLIQLIHVLRMGRVKRSRVLDLISKVLGRGADPNLCCVEVYGDEVPDAYVEAIKLTNSTLPGVTFSMLPDATLSSRRAEENAEVASVIHRLRSPDMSLQPAEAGQHLDLTTQELNKLEFKAIFDEVSRLKQIQESDAGDTESIRSSMFGSMKNFDFGAPFPQLPKHSGECEYPPLFWAIEAASKEGHKEALDLVLLLLRSGASAHYQMKKNHYSWIEGSMVAMAVSAAVEAAAPLVVDEEDGQYEALSVAEVLLRLNQQIEVKQPEAKEVNELLSTRKHPALAPKKEESFYQKIIGHGGEVKNVQRAAVLDALRETRTHHQAYTVDEIDDDGDRSDSNAASLRMEGGVLRPSGSRFGPSHLAARRDVPGLVRTVVVGQTSLQARALAIAREENARRAKAIKGIAVNLNNCENYSLASSRSDKNIYTSDDNSESSAIAAALRMADNKELEWAIAEDQERAEREAAARMPNGLVPKGFQKMGIRPVEMESDEQSDEVVEGSGVVENEDADVTDEEKSEDDPEVDKAYAEIDRLGAPSEIGDDEFLESGAKSPMHLPDPPVQELTYEELETRRASRAKTAMAIAIELLNHCDEHNIDAFARNPLLSLYGVGLVPYEYTSFFAALYGAATSKSQEQLAVGIALAKICANKGADIDRCGYHSMLAPECGDGLRGQLKRHRKSRYKDLRKRYVENGDQRVLSEKIDDFFEPEAEQSIQMRSYPLMWGVTAAIRSNSRKLGCEDLVRYMLMEGADPTSISVHPVNFPKGVNVRAKTGSVLYLWGASEDLFRVSQHRYQTVMSVRLNIGRMLSECGARSSYRTKPDMQYITNRAQESTEAGRWLVKGTDGFGIVAAPLEDKLRAAQAEPFKQRVARALHADGDNKRYVTNESTKEKESDALLLDQGANINIGTWLWPSKEEAEVKESEEERAAAERIVGYRPTSNLTDIHRKHPGQIELLTEDSILLEGDRLYVPAQCAQYDRETAISIAESQTRNRDLRVHGHLRRAQADAVRAAMRGASVPDRLIDDTLLPADLQK